MDKINFLEIFKQAWKITWNHKYLWWLGFFVGSGAGISLNFPSNFQEEPKETAWMEKTTSFIETHAWLVLGFISLAILFFIALELFKVLAYSGLIRGLIGIGKGETQKSRALLKEGKSFFARILGIRILFFSLTLALIIVLAIPVIFLFSVKSFWLGGITALMALLILIPLLIASSFIKHYGDFYVLTSGLSIKSSLEQGYLIFTKNIGSSLVMALLFIPVNIVAGLISLAPIAILAIISVIFGFVLYQLLSTLGIWIIGSLAGVLLLALLLFIRSALGVFYHSAWLLFFQEIATVKKEEIEAKEELVLPEEIQPEKA